MAAVFQWMDQTAGVMSWVVAALVIGKAVAPSVCFVARCGVAHREHLLPYLFFAGCGAVFYLDQSPVDRIPPRLYLDEQADHEHLNGRESLDESEQRAGEGHHDNSPDTQKGDCGV